MFIGRVLGWLLLIAAVVMAGSETVHSLAAGHWTPQSLGEAWAALDPTSFRDIGAFVRDDLWAPLWDPFALTVLDWPAGTVAGGLGLILVLLCRFRPPKRRRSFR